MIIGSIRSGKLEFHYKSISTPPSTITISADKSEVNVVPTTRKTSTPTNSIQQLNSSWFEIVYGKFTTTKFQVYQTNIHSKK